MRFPTAASLSAGALVSLHSMNATSVCRTFQIPFVRGAAFADNLEFLQEILKTLHKYALCVRCRA